MTYRVVLTTTSEKQLKKLETNIQERILDTLERIKTRPYDFVKKLSGSSDYRLRVGDYRIIVKIINDQLIILVLEVGHRRNIYK